MTTAPPVTSGDPSHPDGDKGERTASPRLAHRNQAQYLGFTVTCGNSTLAPERVIAIGPRDR